MSLDDQNFKIAFLVDARRRVTPTEKPVEVDTFSRGIRLCVLKLLSYFAHLRDDSQHAIGHLRWGLKVFHSYDYPPCKRDYLKQLSLKHFQDFEEQLAGDLEALSSTIRGKRAPKTPQVLTATSLRQALDDVIHDFQWDGPDVCSPVKRSAGPSPRKKRPAVHPQSSDRALKGLLGHRQLSKCVFLLMPCPVSRSELEEFCDFGPDDPLPSATEFLEMVLPRSSSHQTFQDHSIALFWIDTSPWLVTEKRNSDGLSVVSKAMEKLGGSIIPAHALANRTHHITTSLQSPDCSLSSLTSKPSKEDTSTLSSLALPATEERKPVSRPNKPESEKLNLDDKRRCSPFLPFSSIMNHYLKARQKETSLRGGGTLKLCSVKDGQVMDFCQLEVCPLMKQVPVRASPPRNAVKSPSKAPARASTHVVVSTSDWSQTFDLASSTSADPGSEEVGSSPTTRSRRDTSSSSEKERATIWAKFPVGAVPISQYQADAVYTCTGLALDSPSSTSAGSSGPAGEANGPRHGARLSTWFKDAMVGLSQQRMVLLVDMPHPVTGVPVTAVLEPLTPTTASLRILKSWPMPGQVSCGHPGPMRVPGVDEERQPRRATRKRSGTVEDASVKITRIATEAAKRHRDPKEFLTNTAGTRPLSLPSSSDPCGMVSFRPHLLEPWFSYCPSGGASARLIDQLQSVPHQDKFPEKEPPASVNDLLQQLEEAYRRQPGTVSSQSLPVKTQEQGEGKAETQARPAGDPSQVRQSPRLKKLKSSINIGFRTERIMQNSRRIQTTKEPSPQKKNEKENRAPAGSRAKAATFECPKFESEEDVVDCLRSTYEKTVSENACAMTFVQFVTSLVLSYMKGTVAKETEESDPVTHARALLSETLLASSNQLRDKYQSLGEGGGDNAPSKLRRVQEIELQVLLRMEMEALSPTEVTPGKPKKVEGEDCETESGQAAGGESSEDEGIQLPEKAQVLVDEMVKLLRAVPFLADPHRLTTFLSDTLLQNYSDSLPHILRAIYDDLMQPVPSVLLSPSSDVAVASVQTQPPPSYRSSSHGSFAEPSVSSVRTRSLARHPSLADMGSKRVIPVPSRNVAKKKEKPKAKPKEEKDDGNSNAKTVRRNLFMGGVRQSPRKCGGGSKLQRRQSVAVMQTIPSTRKSPRRRTPSKAKAPLVLKTRVVKETPGKKQVLQAMLKKQERARRVSSTSGENVVPPTPMRVVEESPLKPVQAAAAAAVNVRRSPRIKPRNPGDRRSFYSTSSMNDLTQARDLAARISGIKTPPAADPLPKPASRKSLLSEICSPGSLPSVQRSASTDVELKSPGRNTRSQVSQMPSKDSPMKVDKVGISPNNTSEEEIVFKTPTRAPRRINFKSPAKSSTATSDVTTGSLVVNTDGPIKTNNQRKDASQQILETENLPKSSQDAGLQSPERLGRRVPRITRNSLERTQAEPEGVESGSVTPTPKADTKATPKRARSVLTSGEKDCSDIPILSGRSLPDGRQDDATTPSRRSKRLKMSPVSSHAKQASSFDFPPEPLRIVSDNDISDDAIRDRIPRGRKRTLADLSPSPNTKSTVNTPSPQKPAKSITPSSLQKWQRRKKPRRDSPEKSSSPVFPKVTPPSAKRNRKLITTPPLSESPKFGKVMTFSEKQQRSQRSSTKKQDQGIVASDDSKGKATQYKLGKVCKANVNLLALMTDLDGPKASKMQTRSRSQESRNSEDTSSDLQSVEQQETETYTFVDSHLDDSDDDIDFPKMISPLRPNAKASDEGSPFGINTRDKPRSPGLSARSSISVFLSDEDHSLSTEDVFLQASPSSSKKRLVTTPLTTGGLFELMNSPMVASGPKTEVTRPRVSFNQPTRKGGRQLYQTASQPSSECIGHNMARRSSSLGLRRLSSGSPTGVS